MKIELLHYTPIEILAEATALPYDSKPSNSLVKRVFDTGHRSVVRHSIIVFKATGISQSLLRQLSRHPHINLTVKSSRYCKMDGYYTPIKNFKKMPLDAKVMEREYHGDMMHLMKIYEKWKEFENGQKEVDVAKLFLPLGSVTDAVISGNYQAIYEFLQLRLCARAENEIKDMAIKMSEILKKEIPEVFGNIGCKGKELGYCPEFKSCGKYPKKSIKEKKVDTKSTIINNLSLGKEE